MSKFVSSRAPLPVAFEAVHPVPRVETTAEGEAPLQAVFPHPSGEEAGLP